MATEEKEAQASEDKKGSSKLPIIIAVVVVVLLVVVGVVAFLLLSGEEEQAVAQAPVEKQATKPKRAPVVGEEYKRFNEIGALLPLDPFTVNLKSDSGKRYLKATISLELEGKELAQELTAKIAVIRDRVIKILSSKTVEEISSQKGKQKVTEQIMDTLNAMIVDGSVEGVYFTEFIVQ